MSADCEYGIFLPIGDGGWIMSERSPRPENIYAYNRDAAVLAERHGFDFIMSMAKWRGYGGSTDHWGRSLESMTMMAGLAEATERVKVWATVHAICFHPALVAKIFATLDQISGGRTGMNIVVGAYTDEFRQMGLWPEYLSHDDRYRYTTEWIEIVSRLWSEESVNFDGEFFHLADCRSHPQPQVRPTLICAGSSAVGIDFTTSNCDGAFVGAPDLATLKSTSDKVHDLAQTKGRVTKTYAMMTVVMDESDEAAAARVAWYEETADLGAIENLTRTYASISTVGRKEAFQASSNKGFQTERVIGSPETVAARLEEIVEVTGIDGLMLIFPNFRDDLDAFGQEAMPLLGRSPVNAAR
jgi:pyrimidine oxygenase